MISDKKSIYIIYNIIKHVYVDKNIAKIIILKNIYIVNKFKNSIKTKKTINNSLVYFKFSKRAFDSSQHMYVEVRFLHAFTLVAVD